MKTYKIGRICKNHEYFTKTGCTENKDHFRRKNRYKEQNVVDWIKDMTCLKRCYATIEKWFENLTNSCLFFKKKNNYFQNS